MDIHKELSTLCMPCKTLRNTPLYLTPRLITKAGGQLRPEYQPVVSMQYYTSIMPHKMPFNSPNSVWNEFLHKRSPLRQLLHFCVLLLRRPDASVRFPIVQQPPDLFERDGFRHEEIHAAGERFALVSAGREARQGDDQGRGRAGSVAVLLVVVGAGFLDVADGSGGFEAIHNGHAYVFFVVNINRFGQPGEMGTAVKATYP